MQRRTVEMALPLKSDAVDPVQRIGKAGFILFAVWFRPSPRALALGAPCRGAFERAHLFSASSVTLVPPSAGRVRVSVQVCVGLWLMMVYLLRTLRL